MISVSFCQKKLLLTNPFIRTNGYSYKLQMNYTKTVILIQEASKPRLVNQIAIQHSSGEVDQSPIIASRQKYRKNDKAKSHLARTYRTPKEERKQTKLMKLSKTQNRHELLRPRRLKNSDPGMNFLGCDGNFQLGQRLNRSKEDPV